MDALRQVVSHMENQEKLVLSKSTATQRLLTAFTPLIIVFAALLTIVISIIYYYRLRKKYGENIDLRQDLEQKEKVMAIRLTIIHNIADKISKGDYNTRVDDHENDNLGGVSHSLNKMAESLSYAFGNLEANEWLQKGINGLNNKMLGQKDLGTLTAQVLEFLVDYTKSSVGALYIVEQNLMHLKSSYALSAKDQKKGIKVGEGISGQAAISKKTVQLKNIDKNSIAVTYASGEIMPAHLVAVPVFYGGEVISVIELAALQNYNDLSIRYLEHVAGNIGLAISTAQNHQELQHLLKQTQQQTEELRPQAA